MEISRDGHRAVVEITRFREISPGPPNFDSSEDGEDAEVSQYGDPQRDITKSFAKLTTKLSQLGDEPSIIAVWNDDGDLVEWQVEAAVIQLCRSAARRLLTLPNGLLFVLYGSQWVRAGDQKQLYCFSVRSRSEPYQSLWQQELATSTARQLIARALAQGK